VTPEINDLPAPSRIASAAGALIITSVILLAIGLGFSTRVSAQDVQRPSGAPIASKSPAVKVATIGTGAVTSVTADAAASVERGRYLVSISGCNDCHTAGYAENGGTTPQSDWLMGAPVGFRGPWGVSYPSNLRLTVQGLSESEWLRFARAQRLPPMPWFNLRDMNDDDLRSMYRFIRALGPKGERMPAAVAPNGRVATPFIQFTPQSPSAVSQADLAKQGGRS
jgi:mono/diheme cytochrome c family protein